MSCSTMGKGFLIADTDNNNNNNSIFSMSWAELSNSWVTRFEESQLLCNWPLSLVLGLAHCCIEQTDWLARFSLIITSASLFVGCLRRFRLAISLPLSVYLSAVLAINAHAQPFVAATPLHQIIPLVAGNFWWRLSHSLFVICSRRSTVIGSRSTSGLSREASCFRTLFTVFTTDSFTDNTDNIVKRDNTILADNIVRIDMTVLVNHALS